MKYKIPKGTTIYRVRVHSSDLSKPEMETYVTTKDVCYTEEDRLPIYSDGETAWERFRVPDSEYNQIVVAPHTIHRYI